MTTMKGTMTRRRLEKRYSLTKFLQLSLLANALWISFPSNSALKSRVLQTQNLLCFSAVHVASDPSPVIYLFQDLI